MRKRQSLRFHGPRWLRRVLRRFVRHEDATSAVEFGLVALPFFALLFAIIETAVVFFAAQALEAAAANSARLILTGQARNMSADSFKSEVCKRLNAMFDCGGTLSVDVKTYVDFKSVDLTTPMNNGNLNTGSMGFSPGGSSSIVVLRLYYPWPIYVSLLNKGIADLGGSKKLLVATAVFRNEPF